MSTKSFNPIYKNKKKTQTLKNALLKVSVPEKYEVSHSAL